MQFFDRTRVPPPDFYRSPDVAEERRQLAEFMRLPRPRMAQSKPPTSMRTLQDESISLGLGQLFNGKCAFCESRSMLGIHLFRPAEEADPLMVSDLAHLYYTWLRTDWGNCYSICGECSANAGRLFPVYGDDRGALPTPEEVNRFASENYGLWRSAHPDRPLLLDPCAVRDFTPHLSVDLNGQLIGKSRKGRETIAVFALDREDLVQRREMEFASYLEVMRSQLTSGIPPETFSFRSMEFGGAWYLLLRRVATRLSARLEQDLDASKNRIGRTLERVFRTAVGRDAFGAALDDIRTVAERPAPVRRRDAFERTRRLTGIKLENFKALELLALAVPDPITADEATGRLAEAAALLVLGENAAGKSSILEAVALALSGERVRGRIGKAPRSFILDPGLMGRADIALPSSAGVELQFADGEKLRLDIAGGYSESGATDGLPPVFAYGAFRQYGGRPSTRIRATAGVATLFNPSHVLPSPEAWLLSLDEPRFALVIRALRDILSTGDAFDVIERDQANERCLIITSVGEGDGVHVVRTPFSVASSGFRSVLAMICDVLQGLLAAKARGSLASFDEAEAVILVDEIEAHLHPRWKMQIMSALRRVLPRATLIATTHDPLCLRGMHDQEVVVLNRVARPAGDDDPRKMPVVVETVVELPNVENLTIEQLLTSDLFSMFSTDSPDAERKLAELGSLLAKRASGQPLSPVEVSAVQALEQQVIEALPLGSSEVHRIVQTAIAAYLQERRNRDQESLRSLQAETRDMIVQALKGY